MIFLELHPRTKEPFAKLLYPSTPPKTKPDFDQGRGGLDLPTNLHPAGTGGGDDLQRRKPGSDVVNPAESVSSSENAHLRTASRHASAAFEPEVTSQARWQPAHQYGAVRRG